MKRLFVVGLATLILCLALTTMSVGGVYAAVINQPVQAGAEEQAATMDLSKLGAGIAIAFAALGAGLGLGTASAAAIGAVAEKPELFGRTIIYVVFIEAVAIYGLVVALLLWIG